MKINNVANETVVNMKNRDQVENKEGVQQQEQQGKVKHGAVKGSDLNLMQDSIEEKKKKAMEDAMEFVKNQFKSDQMVDDILGECRDTIKTSKAAAEEAAQELGEIKKQKEELGEMYPDKEDEEYKMRLSELNEAESYWNKQYKDSHDIMTAATRGIKGIKLNALKYHGMVDADKAAEATLKAASDEIVGMLKDEAIDKIDKDMEEIVEEAEEAKEEQVKEEVEREEVRYEREKQAQKVEEELEKQKQRAKATKPIPDNIDVSELLNRQNEIVKHTEQVLEEQKLLAEDIKGIVTDSLI